MSNKAKDKLTWVDQAVRTARPTGAVDGVRLVIEFVSGFEKFNTRPYHNYETWGDGWRITDPELNIVIEREDLDDAVNEWAKQAVNP